MNRVKVFLENRIVGMNAKAGGELGANQFDTGSPLMLRRQTKSIERLAALSLFALIITLFSASTGLAATITSTAAGGNWNAGTSWVGGTAPGSGDDAVIVPGATLTVTASTTVNSIVFSNTANTARTLTVNTTVTLTVTTSVTLQNAAGATNTNATITGAGTINCVSVQVAGTTAITGDSTSTVTSTISTLSISGGLTLKGTDSGNDDNNATFALASGSVSVAGTVTLNEDAGSTVNLTLNTGAATGTLTLSGSTPFTDVGTPTVDFNGATATVVYSGAAQTIRATTYNNLTLSGSGIKTPAAGFTTNNNLTIDSGVTLDVAAFTLTIATGTIIVNGTLDFSDSTGSATSTGASVLTMASTGLIRTVDGTGLGPAGGASLIGTWTTTTIDTNGTVEYNRNVTSAQTVTDRDYNNLTITGSTQTKTWTRGAARTVNGNLTINASAPFTLAGNQTLNVKKDWSNSGTFTTTTGTVAFTGTVLQNLSGSSATAFFNLTTNNTSGLIPAVTFNQNASVASTAVLTLTTDLDVISPSVLTTTGSTSAAAGAGDVVGTVSRTDAGTTTRSFGNVNVQINTGNAAITNLTVKLVKMSPPDAQSAVDRTYTITQVSAGSPGATSLLRLRYIDTELHGNSEATLELWKKISGTWTAQGQTARDSVNNWVEKTNIGGFSDWIINGPTAPTDVAMVNLKATRYDNRVLLEWRTGYEVRNLGFNIYREQKGSYSKINPEPVAGSALLFGPKVSLRTGFAYAWWDKGIADCGLRNVDCENTSYWIEDLDLSGHSSMHGPFGVERSFDSPVGKEAAPLLGAIGSGAARLGSSAPVERLAKILKPTAAGLAVQAGVASQQAVKLSVKHEGWYRVEQSDLVAAGISGNSDPQKLQVFVDGQEIPILVTAPPAGPAGKGSQPTSATWDGIEFYGIGIDSAFTDSHVYWLVAGSQNGLRINTVPSNGGTPAPATFPFAVERRDKVVYFPSLKNGGAEKFFGPLIYNAQPADQSLSLQHVATTGLATLDVSLQGYTDAPHSVTVLLNGSALGTVQFTGLAKGTAQYSIPQTSLLEGSNQVQLISPAGFSDISMVEYVRMTYQHTNTADGNALRFPATGSQQATITGFTSSAVRVVDVTDAASPQEVTASVVQDGAEYSATVTVPGAGARTLLAFAVDQRKTPASLVANQPSSWGSPKNGANYVAVTRKDLLDSFQLLIKQRKNQGLKVSVVDIEDVYDEFSFGNKTPQALKDFFAYTKSSWKIAPRFALLAGDATYDPKNYTGAGDNDVVPTKLVETAFSETATDDWLVDFNGDQVPDIAIGRLPVRTAQEAAELAAKIVRYDGSAANRRVVMVADQNEGYDFETADTHLQALLPANLSITDIRRGQVGDPNTRTQLLDALNLGAKFVNYYGHGSTLVWTNASILTATDAASLANTDRLALFDAMTCFNGFFHDVSIDSLGEALLKAPGGAIAVWASSGMTDPGGQVLMNEEAIRQLFSGAGLTIGEVTARAKAATGNPDVRRTWILLGDPATKLK